MDSALIRYKPGLLFVDPNGDHWLTCRRPRWPEAPVMLCNLHDGRLCALLDVEGLTFVGLSLSVLLRIISERLAHDNSGA